MAEILKNIAAGMGSVFLVIPRRRHYSLRHGRRISTDQKALSGDFTRISGDLRKITEDCYVKATGKKQVISDQ